MTKKKKLLREGECNVTQATELLKMPVSIFKQWLTDGTLNGVDHPAYRKLPGLNRAYQIDSVKACAKDFKLQDIQNWYPEPAENLPQWTSTIIRRLGRVNLLAQAIVAPVAVRIGSGAIYEISLADDVTGKATPARDILGRRISGLAGVTRLSSGKEFPGIEFIVREL